MKVLFVYHDKGRKIKQVYFIGTDEVIPLNGNSEPGHPLYFWPEGHKSNSYILAKDAQTLATGQEIKQGTTEIYPL